MRAIENLSELLSTISNLDRSRVDLDWIVVNTLYILGKAVVEIGDRIEDIAREIGAPVRYQEGEEG